MVPNTKVLTALGFALVTGVSTAPLITADRSIGSVRSAMGFGSPAEPGPDFRAWENPTIAEPVTATPRQIMPRDERRRAAAADPARSPSSPASPTEGAPRTGRSITAGRQARPSLASTQEDLPNIVPPPARRRPVADASPIEGAASQRARFIGNAPVQRPVQRLAGDFQGQGSTRPARGGDGLLRWLSE